ncbi:uncharacterized protein BX663DRAFT_488198 [Cokeromyces recurvatus]|uniref:uncharacterized protein n=1 Tax=Cokeromyces recurvatus TaxID=90255 RepID=UPI0022210D96|nr:uncharacterized protein BX663DRAFT_488198 [Cokeromyces recurvatus]KAI7900569.1 hypothetical protein BX663DRAFT_488198 [Cokeromyces recurvatus]
MCGRFSCSLDSQTVKSRLYDEHVVTQDSIEWKDEDKHRPSYNVCPARWIPTLYELSKPNSTKVIQSMQWGFIPSWMTTTPYSKPINARSETLLDESSIYDQSKNTNRCIIIAEGFYEWKMKKQPFYIKRKDGRLMLFAGLFSTSHIAGVKTTTCTIITTSSETIGFSKIHHRIPVILNASEASQWLDHTKRWSKDKFASLMKPFKEELEWYQVTEKVGSIKNDSKDLNQPLDQTKNSISYFLQKGQEEKKSIFNKEDEAIKKKNVPMTTIRENKNIKKRKERQVVKT